MSISRLTGRRGAGDSSNRTSWAAAILTTAALLGVGACSAGTSSSPGATASSAPPAATSTGASTGTGAGSAASGPVVPAHSTLHWHSCAGQLAQEGAPECTTLSVPVNYAQPGGRHISVALDMVPATAPKSRQQGVLLVNPGGPGGDGLPLAAETAQGLSPGVAAEYDIVGFDPRGVGSSVPSLSCDRSFFSGVRPNYIPASAAAQQVLVNRAKTYAADCEQKYGWLLPSMTSENTARDMDSIRAAFGVSKINYYAFSYGTYMGEVYATLFPDRVRRMILDSVVDPTGVWYADNVQQDYAFQGRMTAFFAWTAKYNGTYHLGTTAAQVLSAWYRARNQLLAHPVDQMVGADEFDDTFLQGGYLDQLWPGLAQALSSYLNAGQAADLIAQYQSNGVQGENEFAVYNAVQCSDVNWPRSWSFWASDTKRVYANAPFQAWDNAWFNAACAFWPVQGPARPLQIKGTGLPGILMLQGTLDPATPYAGAQNAHKLLPSARMVVVEGGGNHGQSMEQPSNSCVQGYLNAYLGTGALPSAPGLVNARCPAVPAPTPGA
ncbi:MAG TPA: alpha/beta hydrolase [Streptosporangiaceae bacterium]|nr:alpha/beta hydrolase [Streptosporangiaceae bacterium]